MSKNKKLTYVMNDLKLSIFAHKNKLIWIAKVKYQRIANFQNSQIVTGKLRT
jgi:hypothetical protein